MNIVDHLIITGEIAKAQNYLKQINTNIKSNFKKVPNLGNTLVNAIAAQKISEYPHINLICKGSGSILSNIPISEFDLCTILVNLLDNAFDYSHKNSFETIYLYLYCQNSALLVHITNSVTPDFTLKSLNHTSKKEANHGLGITNAMDSLKRNGGTLTYELYDDSLIAKVKLISVIKYR